MSEPCFFFHIPKTAGDTLQSVLVRNFSEEDICHAYTWTTLLKQNRATVRSKKLFQGHFYGPLESIVGRPCFTFTLLRDPIERALSHYGHVLHDPNHYLHQRAVALGSIEAYLDDPEARMTVSNFQARMLALDVDVEAAYHALTDEARAQWGLERYLETTDFGLAGESLLETARKRLENLGLVGITERFDETLALLCFKQRWGYPAGVTNRNVNVRRTRADALSPDTIQRLKQLNEVDIPLYEGAVLAFKKEFGEMLGKLIDKAAERKTFFRLFAHGSN